VEVARGRYSSGGSSRLLPFLDVARGRYCSGGGSSQPRYPPFVTTCSMKRRQLESLILKFQKGIFLFLAFFWGLEPEISELVGTRVEGG
jgi:hypothetical protein